MQHALDTLPIVQADLNVTGWEMTTIFLDRATCKMLISTGRIVFVYPDFIAMMDSVPVVELPLANVHLSYHIAYKEQPQ
jgi:hypothetical protein